MPESYTIKTSGFEGPFGLLLELIEKRKLFINDVSLSDVTDDYLAHISKLGGIDHAHVASFVVVASTLMLIKSKSLLPNLALTQEEESDIHSLEERLRLYELFTKLGGNIKGVFGAHPIFTLEDRKRGEVVFLPDAQITKDSMMSFASGVLDAMPKKVFLPEVEVKKVISIEEMIDRLTDRIQDALSLSFRDLTGVAHTREKKVEVIVGFLALLELVRKGIIKAEQKGEFEDILFEKRETVDNN